MIWFVAPYVVSGFSRTLNVGFSRTLNVGFSRTVYAQQQNMFTGGSPTQVDAAALRTLRLRFPKGSRANWHTHSWGQLLMVEEGRGRAQVRGGPVLEMLPGQPWFTGAGIEHWHGAAPDQDALQLTIYEGTVKWLEPVSDKDYLTPPAPRR
jgi:quercetin dioxygenase-like cupin family protein